MTRIKICGLTRIEDAVAACLAGTDFAGLVFAPGQRQLSKGKALHLAEIIHDRKVHPEVVGVFANMNAKEVNRLAHDCQLDYVQLSGDETWEYCREIEKPVIKAIHVSAGSIPQEIISHIRKGQDILNQKSFICLLDTWQSGKYGGTGQAFNWEIARDVASIFPVLIAGGLTPENVSHLIKTIKPWGVDVSSGVETNGKKDVAKISAFVQAVRQAQMNNDSGEQERKQYSVT